MLRKVGRSAKIERERRKDTHFSKERERGREREREMHARAGLEMFGALLHDRDDGAGERAVKRI